MRKPVGFDAITTQKADYQTPAKGSERCRRPKAVLVEGAPLSNATTYRSAACLRCLAGCWLHLLDNTAWLGNLRMLYPSSAYATSEELNLRPLPSCTPFVGEACQPLCTARAESSGLDVALFTLFT